MVLDGIVSFVGDDKDRKTGVYDVGQDVLGPGGPGDVDDDDTAAAPAGRVGQSAPLVGVEKADCAPSAGPAQTATVRPRERQ